MQIVGNQLWRLGLYVHHFLKSWIWSGNMGNLQKHNKNTIICPKCSFLLQIANISIFIGTMGSGIPDFQTNQAEEVFERLENRVVIWGELSPPNLECGSFWSGPTLIWLSLCHYVRLKNGPASKSNAVSFSFIFPMVYRHISSFLSWKLAQHGVQHLFLDQGTGLQVAHIGPLSTLTRVLQRLN